MSFHFLSFRLLCSQEISQREFPMRGLLIRLQLLLAVLLWHYWGWVLWRPDPFLHPQPGFLEPSFLRLSLRRWEHLQLVFHFVLRQWFRVSCRPVFQLYHPKVFVVLRALKFLVRVSFEGRWLFCRVPELRFELIRLQLFALSIPLPSSASKIQLRLGVVFWSHRAESILWVPRSLPQRSQLSDSLPQAVLRRSIAFAGFRSSFQSPQALLRWEVLLLNGTFGFFSWSNSSRV